MNTITETLARELNKPANLIQNVIDLIDEGNTIPFIARYRKEAHGAMDDETLRNLDERLRSLRNLEARKEDVLKSIDGQGKLTDDLRAEIRNAKTMTEVEDLYRPYKQKRRTRATMAREKGLEPLALYLYSQLPGIEEPSKAAEAYVDAEKGVNSVSEALQGASDIVAEIVSDSADIRKVLRSYYMRGGAIVTRKAKDEDSVYNNYYEFSSAVSKLRGHQVLAVNRGEKDGFLKVTVETDEAEDRKSVV